MMTESALTSVTLLRSSLAPVVTFPKLICSEALPASATQTLSWKLIRRQRMAEGDLRNSLVKRLKTRWNVQVKGRCIPIFVPYCVGIFLVEGIGRTLRPLLLLVRWLPGMDVASWIESLRIRMREHYCTVYRENAKVDKCRRVVHQRSIQFKRKRKHIFRTFKRGSACSRFQPATAWPASW